MRNGLSVFCPQSMLWKDVGKYCIIPHIWCGFTVYCRLKTVIVTRSLNWHSFCYALLLSCSKHIFHLLCMSTELFSEDRCQSTFCPCDFKRTCSKGQGYAYKRLHNTNKPGCFYGTYSTVVCRPSEGTAGKLTTPAAERERAEAGDGETDIPQKTLVLWRAALWCNITLALS